MTKVLYIDPPSGWKFGYPKILPKEVSDVRQFLLDNGYPEKDVDFALRYLRMWEEEE